MNVAAAFVADYLLISDDVAHVSRKNARDATISAQMQYRRTDYNSFTKQIDLRAVVTRNQLVKKD